VLSSQAGLGPQELPELVASDPTFKQLDAGNASIFGHSMGGNGAPTCLLQTAACMSPRIPVVVTPS
jgi:S-formylglutathione hydrolase FrmB